MKTTQSKWETKVHKDNVSIVIKDGVSHGAGDGIWHQDKPIANISDSTYDPEQALTNANLIASAPEMLEMLKNAEGVVRLASPSMAGTIKELVDKAEGK